MIIENLLPNRLKKELCEILTSESVMSWYWGDIVYLESEKEYSELNLFQFTHVFYENLKPASGLFPLTQTILGFFEKETNIEIKSIFRIKANLTTRNVLSNRQIKLLEHRDIECGVDKNYISLIYYVNDSDGDTIFKDSKEKITPKANRLIIFDGSLLHTGSSPKNSKTRVLLNSNFVR